jgi:hypothetical protein
MVAQNKQIAPVSESSLRAEPGAGTASSLKLHAEDLQTGCLLRDIVLRKQNPP